MKKLTLITTSAILLVSLSACASVSQDDLPPVPPEAATGYTASTFATESRSAKDKARDEGRKPADVLNFLGVEAGDTVFDIIAAGGWYSEVLSIAVGPEGKVYAQNPDVVLKSFNGANDIALTARLKDNRLANVVRLDEELTALSIAPNSVDIAVTALNFHDVYNSRGPVITQGLFAVVKSKLKPGGTFAIIDHVGTAGNDNKKLHRIEPAVVIKAAEQAGFVVDGQSDVLGNSADDHTDGVFGALRGNTDRFVLKLKKPE